MKKILFFASAIAGLFLAFSCQKENLEPVADGSVTYTITLADGVQTKGSSGYTEYDLYYEVYKTVDPTDLETATPLIDRKVEMTGNTTNIVLELLNDQDYTVLFWANKKGTDYFVTSDLRNVGVKESLANNDNRDAFCGKDQLLDFDANLSKTVELKRPFAQINIATLIPDVGYAIDPQMSLVTVSDVPLAYNVATKESVGPEVSVTFGKEVIPANYLTVNGTDYKMVAMNYVLVPAGNIDELYYEITTENGVVSNTIKNVPVKPNYRTNIIGNLLTSDASYTVEIKPGFEDPTGGNMEVLNDGIVKNINGDYEITNANGLVYAIENLFEDVAVTGTFYILNSIDMTGVGFDPATVTGKTVRVVGEMPVVTRSSAATTTGIVITGLSQPLINTVKSDASASFTNITIEGYTGTGEALVDNNEGKVTVFGCEASDASSTNVDLVGGNAPIDAGNVATYENFCKALSSGVPEITLAGDITADDKVVVEINRSVVINGNEKTFNTSANRAFRLTTSNIDVVFNDLNIVSTAVVNYPSDVRGVSIDGNLNSVSLTLNGCSIDFTDETTNDWTYAVNVAGNGRGHKVTVEGGKYEGANVINIWGAENTVTVNNATITSLYPKRVGEYLYGACIWVQEKQGSSVYAEGNTFNGDNAVAFNLGEGTVLEENNNTDNTKLSAFEVNGELYSTLKDAIGAIDTNGEIKVVYDYNKLKSTSIPANKKVTLNLNGKSLSGVDESTPSFGLINVGEGAELTVTGPGSISLVATNDRDWNAYSSVISNQRGTLTVNEGVIIEHLGGTDMAYGIDNLTNGKGTSAITTINGATVKSPYRAIRQFLNGVEATNELNVKAGSKIIGSNKSIWMQDPNTNANPGTLVVEKGAELDGDVYLSVTAGSTEWPVSVSIAESALVNDSEVLSTNVPEGYAVVNENGIWKVVEGITTVEQLKAFATEVNEGKNYQGQTVYLLADLDLNNEEWTPIGNSEKTFQGTFDGQNHTISNLLITGSNSYVGLFGFTTVGEIKNLTVNNAKVSGRLGVGVVAGSPYTSKFTNISVTGHVEVNGFSYVGGVGGRNAYANWTDVTVDVDETSYVKAHSVEHDPDSKYADENGYVAYRTYVGGVVGFNGEDGHTFTNITSNIDVKGSTIDVGGLFGIAHYGNNFINCSCSADVEIYNAEAAEDAEEMGGIAGVWHNQNGTKVTFTNCKFTGTLKANITEGVNLSDNSIVGNAYSSTGTGELIIK